MDCLIVDIQPAYRRWCHETAMRVMEAVNAWPADARVVAMYVGREVGAPAGDSEDGVRQYWEDCGATPALLARLELLPKRYGFLRQWMDNGVADQDTVRVLRYLRAKSVRSSDELGSGFRVSLAPSTEHLFDTTAIWVPDELEAYSTKVRGGEWATMGGGAQECLKEVELWVASVDGVCHRAPRLAY